MNYVHFYTPFNHHHLLPFNKVFWNVLSLVFSLDTLPFTLAVVPVAAVAVLVAAGLLAIALLSASFWSDTLFGGTLVERDSTSSPNRNEVSNRFRSIDREAIDRAVCCIDHISNDCFNSTKDDGDTGFDFPNRTRRSLIHRCTHKVTRSEPRRSTVTDKRLTTSGASVTSVCPTRTIDDAAIWPWWPSRLFFFTFRIEYNFFINLNKLKRL